MTGGWTWSPPQNILYYDSLKGCWCNKKVGRCFPLARRVVMIMTTRVRLRKCCRLEMGLLLRVGEVVVRGYAGGSCVVLSWWTYMFCPHFSSVLCPTLWSSTVPSLALHTKSATCMIYKSGSHACGVAGDSPNSLPSFSFGRLQNLNFQLHWVMFLGRFMTLLSWCSSSLAWRIRRNSSC